MRCYREHDDPQRGLLIFSEGRFDARAKLWVQGEVSSAVRTQWRLRYLNKGWHLPTFRKVASNEARHHGLLQAAQGL